MRDNLTDPPYDEGDQLGRVGFYVAVTFALAGVVVLALLWFLW